MNALIAGDRQLTNLDASRLRKLARAGLPPQLELMLNEADLIDARQIPADVITMYAQFVVRECSTQLYQKLVLCYPGDAEPGAGYISVLSPAGLSLLGLRVGATARWLVPGGQEHVVQIEEILFQPEATGDYLT